MPEGQPPPSPYYSQKPIFVPGSGPKRRSRLEGNRMLLLVAVVILLVAAVSGIAYFQRGQQTSLFDLFTPKKQQLPSPLSP